MKDRYYTLTEVRRITGLPRYRITVLVDVLNLPTFRGPNNSKLINQAGLEAIQSHADAAPRPELAAV